MTSLQTVPSRPLIRIVVALSLFAVLLQVVGMVLSAISYTHSNAEPYSSFNHFISELGWPQHSSMARLYNINLSVGSILFAPLIYVAGISLGTRLGYVAMGFGFASSLFACAIGFFPLMRHLVAHLWAAYLFFIIWGFTAFLFALAFLRKPSGPGTGLVIAAGFFGFLAVAAFLIYPQGDLHSVLRMLKSSHRPAFWWPAIFEWTVLISFYLWILAVSLSLVRKPQGGR